MTEKYNFVFFVQKRIFIVIEIVDLTYKRYSAIVWCTAGFDKKEENNKKKT